MSARLSRRGFLVAGLATAASTGAVGLLHLRPAAAGYQVLSTHEIAVVEALAAALFPAGVFPVAGGDGGTAPMLDLLLSAYMDPLAVDPVRYLLRTLEWGTFVSRGQPFSALSPAEAADVLSIWSASDPLPRRLAFDSLRAVMGNAFLRRPEVVRAIGWGPGCGP